MNDPYDGYRYPLSCSDSFVSAMKQSRLVQDCWTELGQQQSLEVCGVQGGCSSTEVHVASMLYIYLETPIYSKCMCSVCVCVQ